MDFDGQKDEKEVYSSTLKKTLRKAKKADFAAKKQARKKLLGNSVTVARLTLDQLVQVRILVPQLVFGKYYQFAYHSCLSGNQVVGELISAAAHCLKWEFLL